MSNDILQVIQQSLGALSQEQRDEFFTALDQLQPQTPTEAAPLASPRSRSHLQPRAEFNGELSHMAEVVIVHLWTHMNLAMTYGQDCESVPGIHDFVSVDVAALCERNMQSVAEMVHTLPAEIKCHSAVAWQRSQLDVLIACHAVEMLAVSTPDVLNSLLYMGPLGEFLAQELFNESVGALMANDLDSVPNRARKKALNMIGDRIKEAFLPSGMLVQNPNKLPPQIPNPMRARNKVCTTYNVPVELSQAQLPF